MNIVAPWKRTTPNHRAVLAELLEGEATPTEIRENTALKGHRIPSSSLSRILTAMLNSGHVESVTVETISTAGDVSIDRRLRWYALTPAGRLLAEKITGAGK